MADQTDPAAQEGSILAKPAGEDLLRYFDLAVDLLCIAGLDGYFKRVNPAWTKLLGHSKDELLSRPWLEFVHPDDVRATVQAGANLADGETLLEFTNRYRCKDGSYRWLSWTARAYLEEQLIYANARDITEQKRVELELRRSEGNIRAMFENAADGIITIDSRGNILSFNPAASRIFGYEIDEIIGKDVSMLMPERMRPKHDGGMKHYLATGESHIIGKGIEVDGLHKDGREVPLHLSVSEVEVGESRSFTGIVRDFTELRRVHDQLERSETRMRAVLNTAADGICTIEADGSVIGFNPAMTRIFGYSEKEMLGQSITLLLPEEARAGHIAWLNEFLGEGEERAIGRSAEFEALRKDGTRIHINLSVSEVMFGEVQHFTGIVRDITDLQAVHGELESAKERFELAVRGTNDGLWDWQVASGEVFYSPRMKEQLGYADDELPNVLESWDNQLHPDDRERVWQEVRDHLEKRVPYASEHRLRTKSGAYRWFLERGQAVWSDDGEPLRMLGSTTDITERKVAELELSQARDAALESDRLKTEFLANMSHELRTPLNSIIGHSEILLEDLSDPEMVDDVGRILTAGRHLLDLVNDLLNLERIEAGKTTLHVESFDARTVVEDVAATVQPLIEANGNRLEWSVDTSLGRLESDSVKLRQILFNLLSNAAKFTKSGTIALDVLPEAHGEDSWVLVRVKDEGIGIPSDRLPRIFESFTQADSTVSRKYGGTGLGLTLTQRLSRLLGGDIEVASKEGRGSTFEVRIPQRMHVEATAEETPEESGGDTLAARPGGGARLLVVDDNEDNRNVLSRRLRRAGYDVSEAREGEEALERIAEHSYDAVLLDVMMPGISGIEVLETVRKTIPRNELPVIMATAKGQSSDIVEAFSAGANDYVTKPLDIPVVLARVATQVELLRLRRQREQLMALKDEFLAIASHDLRNPLSRVLGYTSLVAAKALPGEVMTSQAHGMLGKVERAAHVMQSIIEDFLELAAVEGGKMQLDLGSLDVNAICRDAASEMEEAAEEQGIALGLELGTNVRPVMADERRIRQVLQNLLDNAIKYCRKGDRVTLRTADEEEGTRIEIADTGPGLSPDDMRSVFTRFAELSAKPRKGERSSRMGLSIVRQIVMLHGGDVGVRNNEQGGATFWVILRRRVRGN
jgi:PAS domain S-box-containing protein